MAPLSADQVAAFHQDGYLFVEQLLDGEETRLLTEAARKDERMQGAALLEQSRL